MLENLKKAQEKLPNLVAIAPLKDKFADYAQVVCQVGVDEFSNFSMPKINYFGPITSLDFGEDGTIEVIDVDKSVSPEALENHQFLVPNIGKFPRHAIFVCKPNGGEIMDRFIIALNLLVVGHVLGVKKLTSHLYWAASDQWVDGEVWSDCALPAAKSFKLPCSLWVKVLISSNKSAKTLETLGLRSFVGYELSWQVEREAEKALSQMLALIDYILDPNTAVPQAGQTIGESTSADFLLSASENADGPVLEISNVIHGLVR